MMLPLEYQFSMENTFGSAVIISTFTCMVYQSGTDFICRLSKMEDGTKICVNEAYSTFAKNTFPEPTGPTTIHRSP